MLEILAAAIVYQATVLSVTDGDTLRVRVPGWPEAFSPVAVRVYGLDTPEKRKPPARSACEVALGLRASAYAKTLAKPGDAVRVVYKPGRDDKYRRLLADVTLADGRDWAAAMIDAGYARRYGGPYGLTKRPWC